MRLRKALAYIFSAALLCAAYSWLNTPPCQVTKSAYLETHLKQLPNSGVTIRSEASLAKAIANYGLKDCPSWAQAASFSTDEQVVVYPHAAIIETFHIHDALVGVLVEDRTSIGVGIAVLKGDSKATPRFNSIPTTESPQK